jgi:hypothetical protein
LLPVHEDAQEKFVKRQRTIKVEASKKQCYQDNIALQILILVLSRYYSSMVKTNENETMTRKCINNSRNIVYKLDRCLPGQAVTRPTPITKTFREMLHVLPNIYSFM